MKSSTFLAGLSKKTLSKNDNLGLIKLHSSGLSAFKDEVAVFSVATDDVLELIALLQRNRLPEIHKTLTVQYRSLLEIIEKAIGELGYLELLVKPQYKQEIISRTRTALSIIIDKYPAWAVELASGDRRRIALAQKEITDETKTITDIARISFDYGYGYFNNIAALFFCEYFLMTLLQKSNSLKKAVIDRYINDYFNFSVNYGVASSVASFHLQQIKEMNVLEKAHQPDVFYIGIEERPNGKCVTLYNKYLHVEGNIRDGFRFKDELKYLLISCERKPGRDSFINSMPVVDAFVVSSSVRNRYENAYSTYHTIYKPQLALLASAMDSCNTYIKSLTSLRNSL